MSAPPVVPAPTGRQITKPPAGIITRVRDEDAMSTGSLELRFSSTEISPLPELPAISLPPVPHSTATQQPTSTLPRLPLHIQLKQLHQYVDQWGYSVQQMKGQDNDALVSKGTFLQGMMHMKIMIEEAMATVASTPAPSFPVPAAASSSSSPSRPIGSYDRSYCQCAKGKPCESRKCKCVATGVKCGSSCKCTGSCANGDHYIPPPPPSPPSVPAPSPEPSSSSSPALPVAQPVLSKTQQEKADKKAHQQKKKEAEQQLKVSQAKVHDECLRVIIIPANSAFPPISVWLDMPPEFDLEYPRVPHVYALANGSYSMAGLFQDPKLTFFCGSLIHNKYFEVPDEQNLEVNQYLRPYFQSNGAYPIGSAVVAYESGSLPVNITPEKKSF